jgi:DNA-binding IclR family transcriptional regulator
MSSVTKLLSILDFFSIETPLLTAEEIISKLGCSRPQGYRYIRELYGPGYLTRFAGAYSLGPKIIELDFFIRAGDPLLRISGPLIRDLRDRVACDIALVKMFGDHLIAVHHEYYMEPNLIAFGRGRPMPMFRGSVYKVIMAHLPSTRQKQLFQRYPDEVKASTLGHTWEEMRANLRKIRKAGYAMSAGEADQLNGGIAVPILGDDPNVAPPALVLIMPRARYETSNIEMLAQIMKNVAADISHNLRLRHPILKK